MSVSLRFSRSKRDTRRTEAGWHRRPSDDHGDGRFGKRAHGAKKAANRLRIGAIAMSTRILGAEHVTTLALRRGYAWELSLRGDHIDAVDETRKVLAAHKRVLGEEHLTTMTSKSQLSSCLFSYRKFGEAIELEREVLAVFERVAPTCADARLCAQRVDMMIDQAHKSRSRGRAPRR